MTPAPPDPVSTTDIEVDVGEGIAVFPPCGPVLLHTECCKKLAEMERLQIQYCDTKIPKKMGYGNWFRGRSVTKKGGRQ
ncbi:MAG: hypothetical protein EPO23_03980 [Xanthobacteraceae bacterium]|nr:MAG: hypothetical protein EPO23_03980 [Xanthobacteraceae bacterium]